MTYAMKCVGYDADFVRVLARHADAWVPPPPKERNKRKAGPEAGDAREPKKRRSAVSKAKPDLDPVKVDSDSKSQRGAVQTRGGRKGPPPSGPAGRGEACDAGPAGH